MQPLARMQFVAMVGAAAPSTILKVSQVGTDWGSKTNCGFAIWDGPFSNLCKKVLLAFGQGGDCLAFRKHFELELCYLASRKRKIELHFSVPAERNGCSPWKGRALACSCFWGKYSPLPGSSLFAWHFWNEDLDKDEPHYLSSENWIADTLLVDVDVCDKSHHCLLDLQSFLPPALYLSKLKSLWTTYCILGGTLCLGIQNCQEWTGNQQEVNAFIWL